MSNPILLLQKVILSPGDLSGLEDLRSSAREVLDALEKEGLEDLFDGNGMASVDPDWLSRVYDALADGESEPEGTGVFHAHAEEDASIGLAFAQVLLPGLPPALHPDRWLTHAMPLPPKHVSVLREAADVRAADGFPEQLLVKGVTPLVVFNAIEAISTIVARAARLGVLPPRKALSLDCVEGYLQAGPNPIRAETVVGEISAMTDRGPDVSRGLCHWLIGASWCVPTLFERVQVRRIRVGIELLPGPRTIPDLWRDARFVRVTAAGQRESHPHDVVITKESPNYFQE